VELVAVGCHGVVGPELGPDLVGRDRGSLLGQGPTGCDAVSSILEGLQVLRGVGRYQGGNWLAIAGEVDNLALSRLVDHVGRDGLVGR
jgi:hypothetical protein